MSGTDSYNLYAFPNCIFSSDSGKKMRNYQSEIIMEL